MYYIVLYCTVLYCTVLYCTVLFFATSLTSTYIVVYSLCSVHVTLLSWVSEHKIISIYYCIICTLMHYFHTCKTVISSSIILFIRVLVAMSRILWWFFKYVLKHSFRYLSLDFNVVIICCFTHVYNLSSLLFYDFIKYLLIINNYYLFYFIDNFFF